MEFPIINEYQSTYLAQYMALTSSILVVQGGSLLGHSLSCTRLGMVLVRESAVLGKADSSKAIEEKRQGSPTLLFFLMEKILGPKYFVDKYHVCSLVGALCPSNRMSLRANFQV